MSTVLHLPRRRSFELTATALALALAATSVSPMVPQLTRPARAQTVTVSVRERLSPYGAWRRSERYGEVWVPTVDTGWRPYTVGRWIWTDEGWYWDSAEPFGDVVFHYGRWAYDPQFGWVWVEGDEWAPAWVVWRDSDDDIGWVPAPPPGETVIEDAWWAFVPMAAIGTASLATVLRPVVENRTLIQNTTIINEKVVVNEGGGRTVKIGGRTLPVNAGPPISRLPPKVAAKVRAAAITPPSRGARFGAARLDPSKGEAVKKEAAANAGRKPGQEPAGAMQPKPANGPQQKPAGEQTQTRMKPNGGKQVGTKRMPPPEKGRATGRETVKGKPPAAAPAKPRPQRRAGQSAGPKPSPAKPPARKPPQQERAMRAPMREQAQRHVSPPARRAPPKVRKCDPRGGDCKAHE